MRKRRITAVLVVAAIVAGGLLLLRGGGGGGTDAKAVRATLAGYASATAARDYATICRRYLAPTLLDKLRSIRLPCRSALARSSLGSVQAPTLTVKAVNVNGATALADVHSTAANQQPLDGTFELVKVAGSWRIQSFAAPVPKPAP